MLQIPGKKTWSRRDFLKAVGKTTLATMLAGAPRVSFGAQNLEKIAPKADHVILLWMAGGMAHTETFDPKDKAEFENGLKYYHVKSTFGSIPTAIDGVRISEGLENIASVLDRGTLIRSFSPPDLGHILHSRHQFHWHTGYMPPLTLEAPHIGSMISKIRGPLADDMPSFVHIGQRLDIDGAPEVRAFLTPGFLGSNFAPMLVPYPEKAMEQMGLPEGMTLGRFDNRNKLYKELVANSPIGEFGSGYQKEALETAMEESHKLVMSPKRKAFDIEDEPEKVYNAYNTSRFGRGCLLARRLIEAGVRFVEVSTEHVPFGNWDTHSSGHELPVEMKQWVDAPVAQLIRDLEDRGMLDRTLVILASEFSRAAVREPEKINKALPGFVVKNSQQFGMHKHFTKAGSMLMFGGGSKKGFVYGKSSDEVPCHTIENPVSLIDFHATMYRLLGIPADYSFEIEKRPFYVTNLGTGKPIMDLIA